MLLQSLGNKAVSRTICCGFAIGLLLVLTLRSEGRAGGPQPTPCRVEATIAASVSRKLSDVAKPLIVVGFMGGNVRAGDLVHREAVMAQRLQLRYPLAMHAQIFANRDGEAALASVLQLLGRDRSGCLTARERSAGRIVIFGHSWGASETIALADRLDKLGIPVLLTIQVDSVEKRNENDASIPPNVREAINFYQADGLLHGRSLIAAADPKQTTILGNFESTYRVHPVSCAAYPWYARMFMRPHIEIENDPVVWDRIEALIRARVTAAPAAAMVQTRDVSPG